MATTTTTTIMSEPHHTSAQPIRRRPFGATTAIATKTKRAKWGRGALDTSHCACLETHPLWQ